MFRKLLLLSVLHTFQIREGTQKKTFFWGENFLNYGWVGVKSPKLFSENIQCLYGISDHSKVYYLFHEMESWIRRVGSTSPKYKTGCLPSQNKFLFLTVTWPKPKTSKIGFCRPNLLSHLYFWKSPIRKLDEKLYGISAQKSLIISWQLWWTKIWEKRRFCTTW